MGTELIEDEVKRLFPNVAVERLDADTADTIKKLESHARKISRAAKRKFWSARRCWPKDTIFRMSRWWVWCLPTSTCTCLTFAQASEPFSCWRRCRDAQAAATNPGV